jgi:putative flippase GtrA
MIGDIKSWLGRYPFIKQVIKFCIVGGSAAVINFSFYYSLINFLDWWYVIASVIGFGVSAVFNFTANKLWTFRNKESGTDALAQGGKFLLVMVGGLLINAGIIYLLVDWYLLDYRLAWLGATATVTFWSFTGNRFWTFRLKNSPNLSSEQKYPIIDSDN